MTSEEDEEESKLKSNKQKEETVKEVVDTSNEDIFSRRKKWGLGVQIYRLVNGKFQSKEHDDDIKKQKELEEERKKK